MASVDYFLKVDGIPGESFSKGHENEIDVESWSFGSEQAGTMAFGGGGGRAGVPRNVRGLPVVAPWAGRAAGRPDPRPGTRGG